MTEGQKKDNLDWLSEARAHLSKVRGNLNTQLPEGELRDALVRGMGSLENAISAMEEVIKQA